MVKVSSPLGLLPAWVGCLRSARGGLFLKDIVVNAVANQTTIIALRPDSFRAHNSGRREKHDCKMERNLAFAAEDLDEAGIAPCQWGVRRRC